MSSSSSTKTEDKQKTVYEMAFNLWDLLRFSASPEKKKALFANDKEAYDFCRQLYRDTGGVTPELRRAYEFYKKNLDDECREQVRPDAGKNHAATI